MSEDIVEDWVTGMGWGHSSTEYLCRILRHGDGFF